MAINSEENLDRWQNAERILCIRLDSLGDVLMTTPAMRALKEGNPSRRLTLLTSPAGGKVAPLLPFISDAIVYDAPWIKATRPREGSSPDWEIINLLKDQEFDAAIIFTVFSQNPLPAAMLAFLAEIPLSLAYCRENPYQLLTDWVKEQDYKPNIRHEVRRQLDLVGQIGCRTGNESLTLKVPEQVRMKMIRFLDLAGVDLSAPWMVLHPGASAPSRRYPPELFAEAVRILVSREGLQVILTGTQYEMPLVQEVQDYAGVPVFSMAGCLDLSEFAALISLAPVILSNNSGPVHIAAAVGTPLVDLYALTNPQHTPWMVPYRLLSYDVPCKYCYKSVCPLGHHECLRRISPSSVVDALLDLLQETQITGVPAPLKAP